MEVKGPLGWKIYMLRGVFQAKELSRRVILKVGSDPSVFEW